MSQRREEETTHVPKPSLLYEASLVVALSVGAVPHRCYANVRNALDALMFLHNASLVEGFLVWEQETRIAVIEHGWCAPPSSGVIDPSVVLLANKSHLHCWYVPGIIHVPSAWRQLAGTDLPTVHLCGEEEEAVPSIFREAYHVALSLARHSSLATVPPKEIVVEPSLPRASLHPPFRLHTHIVSSSEWLMGTHHRTREP